MCVGKIYEKFDAVVNNVFSMAQAFWRTLTSNQKWFDLLVASVNVIYIIIFTMYIRSGPAAAKYSTTYLYIYNVLILYTYYLVHTRYLGIYIFNRDVIIISRCHNNILMCVWNIKMLGKSRISSLAYSPKTNFLNRTEKTHSVWRAVCLEIDLYKSEQYLKIHIICIYIVLILLSTGIYNSCTNVFILFI